MADFSQFKDMPESGDSVTVPFVPKTDTESGGQEPFSQFKDIVETRTGLGSTPLNSLFTELAKQTEAPDFFTQVKAGFVDKPEARARIFAAARFPDLPEDERLARYGVDKGEIVYLGDDGKVRRETPKNFMSRVKRWAGQEVANLPADVLSTLGAVVGLAGSGGTLAAVGAGAGAGAGEAIRKGVGKVVFGEEATRGEFARDVGIVGAFGAGGEVVGALGKRAVNRALRRRGGPLAKAAEKDIAQTISAKEVGEATQAAKEVGIDLFPAQATGSQKLARKFRLLEDAPVTTDIISKAKGKQARQVEKAIGNYLDVIAPPGTAQGVGEEIITTAGESLEGLTKKRTKQLKPLFDTAFETSGPIRIESVIDKLDTRLTDAPTGGAEQKQLNRIRKLLFRSEKDDAGNLVDIPEDRLKTLNSVKKEIDHMIEGPDGASIQKEVKIAMQDVRRELTDIMKSTSPEYAEALSKAGELLQRDRPIEKGLVGQLSRKQRQTADTAARTIMQSNPTLIKEAKKLIKARNPEAWDGAIQSHLISVFEKIKGTQKGEVPNYGWHFWKNTVGSIKGRNQLKAAMTKDQFKNLEDLTGVLKKVSIIFGGESTTATRQEALKEMRDQASSVLARGLETDITAPTKGIGRWINQRLFTEYQKELAEAMISEKSARQLRNLKQLSPKSEKFMRGVGAWMGAVAGGEFGTGVPKVSIDIGQIGKEGNNQ